MQYGLDKGRHSVYSLNYHLVVCVRYRRAVFGNQEIVDELKMMTKKITSGYNITIENQEVDKDHMLFSAKPKTDLAKFVNAPKVATSTVIRNRFPEVREKSGKIDFGLHHTPLPRPER